MLIGIIADVHSNAVALKAVLASFDRMGIKKILHAGDIIGYNPYPNETIELFRKNKIISIQGNHDRALVSGDTSDFNPYAEIALKWTKDALYPENLDYFSTLKNREHFDMDRKSMVLIHGSPRDVDEYIYPENAIPFFLAMVRADVLVLGHTHIQFMKKFSIGTIFNPGSLGQPRDADPNAAFAVLDTVSGEVELKRTGYDIEKVIEDMRAAHLPENLGLRLRLGL